MADDGTDPRRLFAADSDHETMFNIVFQARNIAQVVRCAALFSLAEHLSEPIRAQDVAAAEGLDPGATFRLLRACVAFGLARCEGEERFSETPLLRTLRKDDPSALRYAAISQVSWGYWAMWGRLDRAIRSGRGQAEATLGTSAWEYYASAEAAEDAAAFTRSLAGRGAALDAEASEVIDTAGIALGVDLGGASGSFLYALMKRNAAMRGLVLDLPQVEAAARGAAEAAGLSDRVGFVAGDFTKEVPAADLYLLRWILHDWPDETCVDILRACRRAARPGTRLVIVELVLDPVALKPFGAGLDLTMLVSFGSKERTLDEFAALLDAAGFRLARHTATKGPFSILEAALR